MQISQIQTPTQGVAGGDMPKKFTAKDGCVWVLLESPTWKKPWFKFRSEAIAKTRDKGKGSPRTKDEAELEYLLSKSLADSEVEKSAVPDQPATVKSSNSDERSIHIEPETDLNEEWQQSEATKNAQSNKTESDSSHSWDTGQWDKSSFTSQVYEILPSCLSNACRQLTTDSEREVFLVGSLGVLSGLMPNILGHYDGKYVGSNLYAYVLAPYGTGKSGLENARLLGDSIHKALRDEYIQNLETFRQAQEQYEMAKKAYQKEKSIERSPPIPPEAPPQLMLFIPANNSKTGLYQNLTENSERGIMFETEGDTLADAVKQDYAGFTDLLRNAFHHERCTFFRRANGGEYVEITRPYLSLVLSSTFDQLKSLMPTAENGLFSRFLFYEMKSSPNFRNVFDKRKRDYTAYFSDLGQSFKKMYDHLNSLSEPLYFDLADYQQAAFVEQFQAWKTELREYVANDLDGTVNRLGTICFRVAMVFTVLRAFDTGDIKGSLLCTDEDFGNAIRIVEMLKNHAVRIYNRLPKPAPTADSEPVGDPKTEIQKNKCRELFTQGKSCREISRIVFGDERKKSTVYRWTH